MASAKQNDVQKSGPSDVLKGHGLSLSHSKLESYENRISDENDRNYNLSPSKSADPTRKKTFKITSVKKGGSGSGSGSGDVGGDNDADSIDGLDESQTEDLSSEFYDSYKAMDLDMDIQDCMNIPLTPDELTSTTTIVVKQKPDQNSQSRFKVVKIETKEPFRRGKWVCYDFFDTAPATVVTVERNGSKTMEESIIQSPYPVNFSSSSSVQYVQDVNDSSSNIFIPPMSPPRIDGQPNFSDVFVPIQPAPASQVLSQLDGLTSDVMAPFIAQQVLMSVANVPSSSTSFHNLAQSGHNSMIQSLPHTSLYSYPQNGSSVNLFQNGVAGPNSQMINLPSDAMLVVSGSIAQPVITQPVPVLDESIIHNQAPVFLGAVPITHSKSQTEIAAEGFVPQAHPHPDAGSTIHGARPVVPMPTSMTGVFQSRTDAPVATSGLETGEHMGPGMDESMGSIKTLQGDPEGQASEGLKEAVEAVGEMYMGLEGSEDDVDERNSEVAAVFSKVPTRPTTLPYMLDIGGTDLGPYGRCPTPTRSPCCSPLPPTFVDYQAGIIPPHVHSPFFPPFSPNTPQFMDPNYNPPSTPVPLAFPYPGAFMPPTYFPAPQHLFSMSPSSPFAPFGIPGITNPHAFTSASLPLPSVPPLSKPRSMTMLTLPSPSSSAAPSLPGHKPRSLTVIPLPTDVYHRSIAPVADFTQKPRSMTTIQFDRNLADTHSFPETKRTIATTIPSELSPSNMSMSPSLFSPERLSVSDAKPKPRSMIAIPKRLDYKPRSMTVIPVPSVANSRNLTPTPESSFSKSRSMTLPTQSSISKSRATTVTPESPVSKSRGMTLAPRSPVSKSRSMTPTPESPRSKSRSMTLPIQSPVSRPQSMSLTAESPVSKSRTLTPTPESLASNFRTASVTPESPVSKARSMTMIPLATLSKSRSMSVLREPQSHSPRSSTPTQSSGSRVQSRTPEQSSLSSGMSITSKPSSASQSTSSTPEPPQHSHNMIATPGVHAISDRESVTLESPSSPNIHLACEPLAFSRSLSLTPDLPAFSRSLSATPDRATFSHSMSTTPDLSSFSRSFSMTPDLLSMTPDLPVFSHSMSMTSDLPTVSHCMFMAPDLPAISHCMSLTPDQHALHRSMASEPFPFSSSMSIITTSSPSLVRSMSMTCLPSAFMFPNEQWSPHISQSMSGTYLTPQHEPFPSSQATSTDQARHLATKSLGHPQVYVSPPEQPAPSTCPRMDESSVSPTPAFAKEGAEKAAVIQQSVKLKDRLRDSANPPPLDRMLSESGGYVLALVRAGVSLALTSHPLFILPSGAVECFGCPI